MGEADDLFARAAEGRMRAPAPLAGPLRPRSPGRGVRPGAPPGPPGGPRPPEGVAARDPPRARGTPPRPRIEPDRLSSVILWGPPGTGKTTIARLIAGATAKAFEPLSAVTAGVKDVREVADRARARLGEQGRGTILFLDEVHRFSRTQQDALLPH